MAGPRFARLRKPLLRWTCWIAALVALVYLCDYLIDARMRMTKAPGCEWDLVPNPNNLPYDAAYSARFCYLVRGTFLVQVHRGVDELVAERTYLYPDLASVYWESDGLGYVYDDVGRDAAGFIEIPPTLIDRLRAKLP